MNLCHGNISWTVKYQVDKYLNEVYLNGFFSQIQLLATLVESNVSPQLQSIHFLVYNKVSNARN